MEIEIKKKNVHSKSLFNEVDSIINQVVAILEDIFVDTESFAVLIEMSLDDMATQYNLEQINVICDERNNKLKGLQDGRLVIDIYYKHKTMLNITHLSYTLRTK